MAEIDHTLVSHYWEGVKSSILGPYMMDGFGFPVSAGNYRFRAESKIVRRLLRDVARNGIVLDLGSGVGYWAEQFAGEFSRVIAVEGSGVLYQALEERCAPYANVTTVHGDALSFEPDGDVSVVFLGGLLMYLDEADVTALLKRLIPHLNAGGIILCRESTARGATVKQESGYPVVYRSVSSYQRIFRQCGLTVRHVERNEPYVLMQMGCELVKKWKKIVPQSFRLLPVVGRLSYWSMRLGTPWVQRLPNHLGMSFPNLENHFFVLAPESIKHKGTSN